MSKLFGSVLKNSEIKVLLLLFLTYAIYNLEIFNKFKIKPIFPEILRQLNP